MSKKKNKDEGHVLEIWSTKNGIKIEGLNAVFQKTVGGTMTWKTHNCAAEIQFDAGQPFDDPSYSVGEDDSKESRSLDPTASNRYEYTIVVRRKNEPFSVKIDPQIEVDDSQRKPHHKAKKGGKKNKKG